MNDINWLEEIILKNNPKGMSRSEAVQLFLALYCLQSILPDEYANNIIDLEFLVATFRNIEKNRLIQNSRSNSGGRIAWVDLHNKFRSGEICFDYNFIKRAKEMLRK